jgi:DNA gyrase subunit B
LRCYVGDSQVDREELRKKIEKIKTVERYIKNMQAIGINRETILGLMSLGIETRQDFESPEKIDACAERLKGLGQNVERIKDREHNLFAINIKNADPKKGPAQVRVDYELCSQGDYRESYRTFREIREYYDEEIRISDGDNGAETINAEGLQSIVSEKGKEGINIQRYKGLGEMNPEQLWGTTMNPDKRRLLKVSIEDAVEADQVFTVLMGNNIETRRKFIEENALSVRNLDV